MSAPEYDVQVIIASGPSNAQRAILGLSMAASAAASGKRTYVYMAMEGARCLTQESCSTPLLAGYPTVAEYIQIISSADGTVEYCPSCLGLECALEVKECVKAIPMCHLTKPGGMSSIALRFDHVHTVVF